jgi:hypothetical protein
LTDEDLGFLGGRHPARTFSQTEKYLSLHQWPEWRLLLQQKSIGCVRTLPR